MACRRLANFWKIQDYFNDEFFMFVRTDVTDYEGERDSDQWFPHRMQLQLKYWQKKVGTVYKKRLVQGKLILSEFMRPPTTVRGYEYDLRVTFIPVAWIDVLNLFALQVSAFNSLF